MNFRQPPDDPATKSGDVELPAPALDYASRDRVSRLGAWRDGLLLAAAYLLLPARRSPPTTADQARRAIGWIVPIGLILGLVWVGAFRASWRLYGQAGSLRLVPSLVVVLLECLATGPLLLLGLARTVSRWSEGGSDVRAESDRSATFPAILVLVAALLAQFVLISSLEDRSGWWPLPDDWRHHFNFLYPRPIYRPLILAPLWGRWGILLAASVGRPARGADAATIGLNSGMNPGRLLRQALLPLALTAIYCSRSRNYLTGVMIGMIVFGLTYLATVVLVRKGGGQNRDVLFAGGQVSQIAFLAVYRAFWRLIDG